MISLKGNLKYKLDGEVHDFDFALGKQLISSHLTLKSTVKEMQSGKRIQLDLSSAKGIEIRELYLSADHPYASDKRIFVNGFQSWTACREYLPSEEIEPLSKFGFNKLARAGDYTFYKYPGEPGYFHGYTYSYIRKNAKDIFLIASLDEHFGYTILQHHVPESLLMVRKDCNCIKVSEEMRLLDVVLLEGDEQQVFDEYFKLMDIREPKKVDAITGWTSWYNYYGKITEEVILQNVQAYAKREIPIDIFQIDDGYQSAIGDWTMPNEKFPKGMKFIADSIHEKGYKAGLWLAPLVCEEKSTIFQNHPEWLQTHDGETPVKAGYNPTWGGIFRPWYYALDIYNPEVRDYLKETFDTVLNDWGFDMVKLDFLFGVALIPYQNKPRGQIMCDAMELLRECCGDKIILGCGVPLGPSFGMVDYCRIGCDIGLGWEMKSAKMLNLRERISTVNSIKNTISRRHLDHRAFLNDPDVFILREENNRFKENQQYTLFLANHIFGSLVFTSDNIGNYDEETLELYRSVFPHRKHDFLSVDVKGELFAAHFKIGSKEYRAWLNTGKEAVNFNLPGGLFFASREDFIQGGKKVSLEPYQSICYLQCPEDDFRIMGGTAHLFPGSEVSGIFSVDGQLSLVVHPKTQILGDIFIRIPKGQKQVMVNGKMHKTRTVHGINMVQVKGEKEKI